MVKIKIKIKFKIKIKVKVKIKVKGVPGKFLGVSWGSPGGLLGVSWGSQSTPNWGPSDLSRPGLRRVILYCKNEGSALFRCCGCSLRASMSPNAVNSSKSFAAGAQPTPSRAIPAKS